MNETILPPGDSRPGHPVLRQAGAWLSCAGRLVLEQKPLWFGMTAIYFALGFLLTLIPFLGHLLLILITPMLLASVLAGRATGLPAMETAPVAAWPALLQTWLVQPAQELLRIFTHEEKLFGAVLLGIITLGLVLIVKIIGYLFIGGSMVTGLAAGQGGVSFATVLGMALVAALSVLLAMGLFYSVSLTVQGNRPPLEAIFESFATCRENARTLLPTFLPFFIIYLAIMVAFAKSVWLGYLVLLSAGFVALPFLIATLHCSYLTLYPAKFPEPHY